ncbi:MAG TPA: 2Fe-2S iron-sulfur cluster binding domain-containing protein [Phycisphaerales bacterium]|nr:2Fe-2S iron-sulfur cluster binding domain-containing protein [Phycisphaerales bacterium]
MPTITINGVECEFQPGQKILEVANAHGIKIPYYCYHDALSIPAQCRICLGEIWAPNPRNEGKLEPQAGGKLQPTCSTDAADGMVVYTNNPKAVANQKAVMEYLLINHPLDCPVCDQAGECELQDYSFEYGRGVSRFQETKVKQPKKDLGPNVYIYSDRCIMCTRCVRFTREIAGTDELMIDGRGNSSQIDVFPGQPLDNELSANVIDLCPVGALLDKDFLFSQRVWFLKGTPSIDGITASGDNITIEHNEGKIYRFKPRTNMAINTWWITDEVRYGWKHITENRLNSPMRRRFGALDPCSFAQAYDEALDGLKRNKDAGKKLLLMVSPMLSCEDTYHLAKLATAIDPGVEFAVGYVPFRGEDKAFPKGAKPGDEGAFVMYAEKAPNARGVRRVLESFNTKAHTFEEAAERLKAGEFGAAILTGNYPGEWAEPDFVQSLADVFTVLIDTHPRRAMDQADIVLSGATWAEKSGSFENVNNIIQAFEQAIPAGELCKAEAQIAMDMLSLLQGEPLGPIQHEVIIVDEAPGQVPTAVEQQVQSIRLYNAANTRREMAQSSGSLAAFTTDISLPVTETEQHASVEMVEL